MNKQKIMKERFLDKINKLDNCWYWTGEVNTHGYGIFYIGSKKYRAHRISFKLFGSEKIPKDKPFICHTCNNKSCVNPDHLYAGDQYDNMRDACEDGSLSKKLTKECVINIREKYIPNEYGYKRLAREYEVNKSTIRGIIKREIWDWV